VLNLGMADKTATEKQANDQTIEDKSGGEEQGDGYAEALPERPVRVEGATYRIETPLGTAFITVNHNEKHEPFEVFIAVGKAGSEVAAMAEALGRLISTTLRFGNHRPAGERAREIVEQLRGIGGGSAVGFGPDRVRSLPDAVAKAISLHFQIIDNRYEINDGAEEKAPPSVPLSRIHNPLSLGFRDLCPSCGAAALIFEEGCAKCSNCGFSKC
jgi:ribonucleoside-diphosphate reductase alpha chain